MGEQETEFSINQTEGFSLTFEIKYNLKNLKKDTDNISKNNNYEFYDEPFINNNDTNIFYLFETEAHTAFGHWIYESAVFLPFFEKINAKYENLKILINSNPQRTYKKLLMDMFQIPENKRSFLNNEPIFDYGVDAYLNIPINNICIICKTTTLISMNDNTPEKNDLFLHLINNFKNTIYQKNPDLIEEEKCEKTIENLFFPRNQLENYHNRSSNLDYTYVNELLQNKTYMKYDTNNTTDFKNQIKLLLGSQNIYLDFGSSFFVNGLFCKNSTIYVTFVYEWHYGFKCWQICHKLIENNNNKIIFLTNDCGNRLWNG